MSSTCWCFRLWRSCSAGACGARLSLEPRRSRALCASSSLRSGVRGRRASSHCTPTTAVVCAHTSAHGLTHRPRVRRVALCAAPQHVGTRRAALRARRRKARCSATPAAPVAAAGPHSVADGAFHAATLARARLAPQPLSCMPPDCDGHLRTRPLSPLRQHRVSLEGIASVGLVIVLALPLLSGTPVPITCAPYEGAVHGSRTCRRR